MEVYSWMWKHLAPGLHSLNNPGVVDRQGNILFEAPYAPCTSFYREGLAAANSKADTNDVLMGYIDRNGKWIIKPQFDSAHDFSEGLAAVGKDRKGGYIDKSGKYVIQPTYYANPKRGDVHPQPFSEGLAAVPVLDVGVAKTSATH